MPTPAGRGRELDAFNDSLRADPEYQAFLQSIGVNTSGPIRLSGSQRSRVEQFVRQRHPDLAGKFQIDPAGNVNTDHGLSTAWSNPAFRYPLIAGGAALTAGLINPALLGFGGAGGGGGAAASAGAAGAAADGGVVGAAGGGGFFSSIGRFLNSPGGSTLVGAAGNLISNRMESGAAERAAEIQDRYLRDALEYEKERDADERAFRNDERDYSRAWQEEDRGFRRGVFADDQRAFQPYEQVGAASMARLGDMVNQPAPAPMSATDVLGSGQVPMPQRPSLAMMAPRQSAPMPPQSREDALRRLGVARPSLSMMRMRA